MRFSFTTAPCGWLRGSDDIRYNLSVAEARTKDRIEEIPAFFLTEWARGCAPHDELHGLERAVARRAGLARWGCFCLYLLAPRLSLRKAGFYGTARRCGGCSS